MVSDLFVAGGETTITTLQWSVLFLALYPEWQEKVREEIRTVYGKERLPRYNIFIFCADKDPAPLFLD